MLIQDAIAIFLDDEDNDQDTAFRTIYDTYTDGVLAVGTKYLKDETLVEAYCLGVFREVLENKDQCSEASVSAFENYVYSICLKLLKESMKFIGEMETIKTEVARNILTTSPTLQIKKAKHSR